MVAARLYTVRVGGVRKREPSIERAVGALDPGVAAFFLLALAVAFATNAEDAFVHVDLDRVRIDSGNVRFDHETLRFFPDVHARRPLAGDHVGLVAFGGLGEKALENLLQVVLQAALNGPGITGRAHVCSPANGGPMPPFVHQM